MDILEGTEGVDASESFQSLPDCYIHNMAKEHNYIMVLIIVIIFNKDDSIYL
jgi:hypothetical protein